MLLTLQGQAIIRLQLQKDQGNDIGVYLFYKELPILQQLQLTLIYNFITTWLFFYYFQCQLCNNIKMFEDLFDTQEQIQSGVKSNQIQSAWDRLPRTCADSLPLPDPQRKVGYPIGLKNQGATCYLNSLLQILFYTPQLRKTILDLPLCLSNVNQKSNFINESKNKFMLGFQRLFSEMSLKDASSLGTQYLKQSFGWEGSEHVVQHDIQQAMKIILDKFEVALYGTQFEKNIRELFKGNMSRYKSCRNCTIVNQRFQEFYGLNLQVQNCRNIEQSMMSLLTAQSMDGDNKIFCQVCESKQDMWLGTKLKSFPNVLVLTLARFTFDYETFQRVKLKNYYSFNLQENFEHYLEADPDSANVTSGQYQLYGVLIHQGSSHSGHYICYIRDIMQQSDWEKGLKEAEEQTKKQNDQKQKLMTEQQKQRNNEKNKEDKQFKLVEPQNKKLFQNWFELNDSRVTAIDAKRITSKYEGSDSAYILFYRRKDIPLPKDIKVPEYFSSSIIAENNLLKNQRDEYNIKKNQIILKIDGKEQVLSVDTLINDLVDIFCGPGFSLVNEAKHNCLPYYPKQITSAKEYLSQDTVKSFDLIHESSWRKYEIDSDEYRKIQPYIDQTKMPFQVNIYFNEKNEKLVLYLDETLTALKLKVQEKYGISYENQIIKLTTAFKDYFVTDDLSNDDVLLTKLGFMHECQVVLKKLEKGQNLEQKQFEEKIETNTICFVIERDDVHGIKRMYFDKQKTLQQLFDFVTESEGLDKQTVRRFRNLNGDRLFYNDHYKQTLGQLQFDQEVVKIRIERGEVPVKGDICVFTKMQSKFQGETVPPQIQIIFDPNTTILDVKKMICEMAGLDPAMHRIYQTDWMGEPVRAITRQKQSIFDARFGREEKVCLRDIQSPIGSELLSLQLYETVVGTPQDIREAKAYIKIEEHKTLQDLKKQILKSEICKDKGELSIKNLRVREIKKDYMFGTIMRDNKKQLKNYNFNSNKIVVQVLRNEEQLKQNQIVLILKKRNLERRLYEGNVELIWEAGKQPQMEELAAAVKKKLGFEETESLRIAKYVHYDFEWIEISEKYIEKYLKSKAGNKKEGNNNGNNKAGKNKNKQVKKEQETKVEEGANLQIEEKKEQQKGQQKTQNIPSTNIQKQVVKGGKDKEKNQGEKKQKGKAKEENQKIKETIKLEEKREEKEKAQKGKNKGKNKGQQEKSKQEPKKDDCLNLRKAPYLIKDGDWIGYGSTQQLKNDDLQTDEDLTLKLLKKNQKAVVKRSKGAAEKAFKVNTDF